MKHRSKSRSRLHRRSFRTIRSGVPPADIIREDFQRLTDNTRLRTSQLIEELILMQSVEGHAHEGHGAFAGRRFVNTSMQDTVQGLGRDPVAVAGQRQAVIDEVVEWVQLAARGKTGNLLVTPDGDCLFDIGLFRQIEVVPADVLKGIYLGGLRDDSKVRLEAEERYGIRIGGGETALVDVAKMEDMGLDAEKLAHGEWEDRIEELRSRGVIAEYKENDPRRLRFLYIRHRFGGGTSDDAAMLAVGKLFGPSAALGAFIADAIDTFEKYVPLPNYSDQDDELARWIEANVPDLGVSREALLHITHLCAVPEDAREQVPDSSLRRLLAIDRRCDQTALESHLAYLQERPYSPMLLAFEQVPNQEFYAWFEEYQEALQRN
ncbi:MAG: hypothetical protein GTO55_06590 [Armatimonadetes bacterium]|nr:hypothetical protein [Armatimonadota bacterium]NIM23950.1 hypothetical protein [Armatimonadota bacterium]NIM67797.1 hypothetical protein [Armatimonadota bacterium]NIM76337.1 hypothetical protein [Armatimonadota bacterium]NIN06031.1 hypothetical protein [Armatimonadota bacterium]